MRISISGLLTTSVILNLMILQPDACKAQKKTVTPNIIYILADDMGYGDIKKLNPGSQIPTPNLDRMANDGTVFLNAHSGSAVCTPTRYGILTGRYAFRSSLKKGVLNGFSPALIEEDRYTVADLAKSAGYQTAIIGKWHLGLDWTPLDPGKDAVGPGSDNNSAQTENVNFALPVKNGPNQAGFDYSYIIPASLDMPPYTYLENGQSTDYPFVPFKGNSLTRGVFWREGPASKSFVIEKTLDVFIDKAKQYLVKAKSEKKPFFLYLPLTSPHTPWLPSEKFKNKSKAGVYGDFVAHTDDAVGRILRCLDSLNLSGNTLVIFTSDNGADWKPGDEASYPDHHANYIFRGEKSDIWEGGHHIPFIVKYPGVLKPGRKLPQIISLTDLMATMAAITGTKMPKEAAPDSYNLWPLLTGKSKIERSDIIHHSIAGMFAIRQGKWKFIDGKGSGGWSMKVGKPEDPEGQLYNMDEDPKETTNLYNQYPSLVKELKALLDKQKADGFSISTEKPSIGTKLVMESLTGPVTKNEIAAFKAHILSVPAPATADRNVYVYGNPGKIIEACGLMVEVTSDQAILDRMIYYCDAALSGRNDLALAGNGGQRVVWTGKIEPIWPASQPTVTPAGGGVEQGSVLAHILYGAKLILSKPELWNLKVGFGDPNGFGTTYKERALTYVKQADHVIDTWILPNFVRKDKKFYFPGSPNTYKPKEAAPWNQLFMLTNGLIRLSQCHELLKDAPDRVKKYDELVKVNIDWFKENVKAYSSPAGTTCWKFDYALVSRIEDTNHFAYESEGMWLAYDGAKYGVTIKDMTIMANTYFDVILSTVKDGRFAGNVDGTTGKGHAGGDNYVRDEYIYLADIRKEKFQTVGAIEQASGKIAASPQITARLLWLKNRRFKAGIN